MMSKEHRAALRKFLKIYVQWFDQGYDSDLELEYGTEAFRITWQYFPNELKQVMTDKRLIFLFNIRLRHYRELKG